MKNMEKNNSSMQKGVLALLGFPAPVYRIYTIWHPKTVILVSKIRQGTPQVLIPQFCILLIINMIHAQTWQIYFQSNLNLFLLSTGAQYRR